MKTRIAIVVIIAVAAVVLVASSVTAQPSAAIPTGPLPLNTDNIWYTSAITRHVYLPLIALPPCSRAPTLISPTNGSLLTTLVPTLVYRRGTAPVTQTIIYIADNSNFNSSIVYGTSGGSLGPFSLKLFDNLQPATKHYWHVRDQCGATYSPYSDVFTFTTGSGGVVLPAPTLKSPVSGTVGLIKPVTLTWYSVAGAAGYQIHYGRVGSGGYTLVETGGTSYVLNFVSANSTYEWWVVAYNSYAYGAASPRWRFSTGTFAMALPEESLPMLESDFVVSYRGNVYRLHGH
jgi:hypothetical protein